MMVSHRGDREGCQKRDGKFYPVKCTGTEYIIDLTINIFSVTPALAKVFNMKS